MEDIVQCLLAEVVLRVDLHLKRLGPRRREGEADTFLLISTPKYLLAVSRKGPLQLE